MFKRFMVSEFNSELGQTREPNRWKLKYTQELHFRFCAACYCGRSSGCHSELQCTTAPIHPWYAICLYNSLLLVRHWRAAQNLDPILKAKFLFCDCAEIIVWLHNKGQAIGEWRISHNEKVHNLSSSTIIIIIIIITIIIVINSIVQISYLEPESCPAH
jgi:hypothetical protein